MLVIKLSSQTLIAIAELLVISCLELADSWTVVLLSINLHQKTQHLMYQTIGTQVKTCLNFRAIHQQLVQQHLVQQIIGGKLLGTSVVMRTLLGSTTIAIKSLVSIKMVQPVANFISVTSEITQLMVGHYAIK